MYCVISPLSCEYGVESESIGDLIKTKPKVSKTVITHTHTHTHTLMIAKMKGLFQYYELSLFSVVKCLYLVVGARCKKRFVDISLKTICNRGCICVQ